MIDPSLRLVYDERYEEDACQDYIENDWHVWHGIENESWSIWSV